MTLAPLVHELLVRMLVLIPVMAALTLVALAALHGGRRFR